MLELVMVRHGETEGNARKTYMGWTDYDLNTAGIRQAERARERLSGEKFSAIYCSPQIRTLQTAEIICGNKIASDFHKYSVTAEQKAAAISRESGIILENDLRERNFGIFDDLSYEEIKQKYPQEHDAWVSDWVSYRVPEGESSADVYGRVSGFLTKLAKVDEKNSCKKILLVTHKGWIMNAAAFLLRMPIEGIWHFHADPGSITRFEIRDGFNVMKLLNG